MKETDIIIGELKSLATEEKRLFLPHFFKTGKGQYGEGDVFLGVVVPHTRKVAKEHIDASADTITELLASEYHEARLCALLIMVQKSVRGDEDTRKALADIYLASTDRINNWDLVDLSAPDIIGRYLLDKPRNILYELAESSLLWDNRIAIVSTLTFIRNNDLDDTYALAQKMMPNKHDLIHKATGWMLREAGKRDPRRLYHFVDSQRTSMPRTMLRYAIEKFSQEERKYIMRKQ